MAQGSRLALKGLEEAVLPSQGRRRGGREHAKATSGLEVLDSSYSRPHHVEAPFEGAKVPERGQLEIENDREAAKGNGGLPAAVANEFGVDGAHLQRLPEHQNHRDVQLAEVQWSHGLVAVEAVEHVRSQRIQKQSHCLVPEREEAQHAELAHGARIDALLHSLQEELMSDEVPDLLDAFLLLGGLPAKNFSGIALPIDEHRQVRKPLQLAVVAATKHRMDEADGTTRMLLRQILQEDASITCEASDVELRNVVLQGGEDHVALAALAALSSRLVSQRWTRGFQRGL
mmetsp:Transcript_75816/g.181355  ORF Transcript_75816/g.181355 Transcript_75816/m.181355 type:complete len:287 (+) Transcript_75816:2620-3480(+)